MSVVSSTTKHAVRIVALPLAIRSRKSIGPTECLTYYHFETPPSSERASQSWTARVQHNAADLWANLGRAPEGNWRVRPKFICACSRNSHRLQQKVFTYGERFIDRVDFEELALKSFDTSLGPSPTGWKGRLGLAEIPVVSTP